ncbi:MAG: glycosyltransferase family 4 protein [Euryarchaeota archaeon]|nr:glycosyltransferase family 4 protein [Euryarchaeota archaeon]MBU4608130.1 glycosyltransferase family 4 protein [Euryarchaeota archaeon]MBV1728960.1 glycosyltransferase family 4 protein [Methanobacterium sp.]MBV1755627.1 glycosyltransferase family 4 protein [Methanobacterium sp.]
MNKKILYIHQGSHPVHGAFASVITSDYANAGNTYFQMLLRLFGAIRDNNYDIAFLEGGMCLPYAYIKKIFNPRMKIILLNADNLFYILPHSPILKSKIMRFFVSKVDSIISISELNKKEASKYFNGKIYVVNSFGINNHFEINADIQSNKLLFIGNKRFDKRYDLLVDALKLLNKDHDFELYLVGSSGDDVDVDYSWLHKEGQKDDIKPYLEKCSLYIHPADYEAYGVSILESMSAGMIPLVTPNCGAHETLKKEGLDFLILENNQPHTIACKIMEIYEKPFSWKKKVSQQCVKISKKYSQKKQTEKFSAIFKKICQGI